MVIFVLHLSKYDMADHTLDIGHLNDIIAALTEAVRKGQKEIRIHSFNHTERGIIGIPDINEVKVLREICDEYRQLQASGATLSFGGNKEVAVHFAESLIELTEAAEMQDAPVHNKNRQEVELELGYHLGLEGSISEVWDTILEESHTEDIIAPFYRELRGDYGLAEMKRVYAIAIKNRLLDSSSIEDDFLYYFGRLSKNQPSGKLKWLKTQEDLTAFITAYADDNLKWKKTTVIFRIMKDDGQFHDLDSKVLKASFNKQSDNEKGTIFGKWKTYRGYCLPEEVELSSGRGDVIPPIQ